MFVTILYACHYLYFLMKCFLSINPPAYLEKPSTPKKAADTAVQHVGWERGREAWLARERGLMGS